MAEKKRKSSGETNSHKGKREKQMKSFQSTKTASSLGSKKKSFKKKDEKKGPRLPTALRREMGLLNPNTRNSQDSDEENEVEGGTDVYEYDEPMPEEETQKNRRFDPVGIDDDELPENFVDEDLSSDGDDDNKNSENEDTNNMDSSDQSGDDAEEGEDGRHLRMLQGVTGMPAEAFEGKKKKISVVSEAYPESEYNPSRDALDGDGRVSIQDLLNPLQKKPGYNKVRKRLHGLETKPMSVQAPLPTVERKDLERKVAYELTRKDMTKWEPPVKKNREASTIFFDEDIDIEFSTVGAIASEFRPRTEFEKKIDSLVHDAKVVEAHKEDGARLLELNKVSIEDVKDRQNRLAKMRSLLFRHELKAKHTKKIKSKTFHRLMKKDKLKAASGETYTDPEADKEERRKQEFKRAEERMTLKHKGTSKWALHIKERGLNAQDEGTRVAYNEQLHKHAELTRKMESMKDSSSSDESSDGDDDDDEDDEPSLGTEQDEASKLLKQAKKKTLEALEEEDEIPTTGVLSMPFMVRGMEKRKKEAYEEAMLAVEEYESSLKKLEEKSDTESPKAGTSSGRRVFGGAKKQPENSRKRIKSNNRDRDSDSEDDYKNNDNVGTENAENESSAKEVHVDANMFNGGEPVVESFADTIGKPAPKTTYEVAIFAENSWRKMGKHNEKKGNDKAIVNEEVDAEGDTESEEEMVDGMLSSGGAKPDYELPSQEDLIHLAFAGDDVEEDFEKQKLDVLNEENPEPEKPVLLPGWGQWTKIQKKKGTPSWMLEEHESAKKKREDSLKKRKDALLKHVIISEKINKKVDKLHTTTLPFPFTSKEAFERSIRFPIGPEFNPATSVGALIRPEVVKRPGVIIKPIKYDEVNPHEKENGGENRKTKANKSSTTNGESTKRMKK